MSKFANSSVLLLSLIMIAAGAFVPRIELLAFLAEFADYISIAGIVLLVIYLIATFGFKGILYCILYAVIFIAVQWVVSYVFGLLALTGLLYDVVGLVLAILGTIFVSNKLLD